MRRWLPVSVLALVSLTVSARGQNPLRPLPGSRITDSGVVRAGATLDSVFLQHTRRVDTVDIGDFAAHLLARLGVPPFGDSLAFRVSADTQLVRISGRLMDFPPDERAELGPVFAFVDSASVFVAEIAMPRHDHGLIQFHLQRVTIGGFPIPDLLLAPALQEYSRRYPNMLASAGRDFLVTIPAEASARLVHNGIEVTMPRQP